MLPDNTLLQDRYRIIEHIGRGGMGAVYKAEDTRLRSIVALKQTLVEGEPLRKAFLREAQLLATLRHPTLPRVSDHFIDTYGQFLVMEYIPGSDLGAILEQRQQPFALDDVLRWADQLLTSLHYLHTRNPPIIHRDIKPQNLKLTEQNEIILLDFGLAKGSSVQTRVTSTGSIFGYTPHYASLEQIHGDGTDQRSDLYSLAATMYHLLTGVAPADAMTRATAKINDQPDPLIPVDVVNRNVPKPIAAIIQQGMAQKASERPATAAAMRSALRQASQDVLALDVSAHTLMDVAPAAATVVHTEYATSSNTAANPLGNQQKKSRWPVIVIVGLLALLLVAGGAFALAQNRNAFGTAATVPTSQLPPTIAPEPTINILAAAGATQTTIAEEQVATQQAILQIVGIVDATRTAVSGQTATSLAAINQTNVALTPTSTTAAADAPTNLPIAEPPTQQPSSPTREATQPPAPTRAQPAPTRAQPTATQTQPSPTPAPPTPTTAPAGPQIVSKSKGALFTSTTNAGTLPENQTDGGSCMAGRVLANDGSLFDQFYVQVDFRGNTLPAKANYSDGSYSICGLHAGEWGVTVYEINKEPTSPEARQADQVRVLLTGTPGEIFYVNFKAKTLITKPTPVVPTEPPTPVPGPFDGSWAGSISGLTDNASQPFKGSFVVEVRANKVYRFALSGSTCDFETYPGLPIDNGSFGTGQGRYINPSNASGRDDTNIVFSISGTFSDNSGQGAIDAGINNVPCLTNTSWKVTKK